MKYLSEVAKSYPASGIREMFKLAAQFDDVVSLTVGEPNFDTPSNINEAVKKAIDEGYTHYNPNAGLNELRQAIADQYKKYGQNYTADNVMVTCGGMQAIHISLMATINPGDEVLIPDPCFSNYVGQVMLVGGKAVSVPLYEENEFRIQALDIEKAITPRTKAILLNSPSNPLGSVLTKEDIIEIAEVVKKHDLIVYSDEVYDRIIYDNEPYYSIAELPEMRERTLIINSLSKAYAMTGWRLGFVVGDEKIISSMPKMQEGLISCVPTFIQRAAIEAITGPQEAVEEMLEQYRRRRDILIDGINRISGFKCLKSPGSFYAFVNIKAFGKSSMEFAKELIEEARVVTVPGSAFGEHGEGYLRLVFAASEEDLNEALRRIKNHVHSKYVQSEDLMLRRKEEIA